MARRFRLYGKKRGDRRTGSQRLGNYGEALFYGVLLLLGAAGFYLLLMQMIWPEWQANRRFAAAECIVLSKASGAIEVDGKSTYRPEILIQCQIDGKEYSTWTYDINHHLYPYSREEVEEILAEFEVGQAYRCWYDPTDPTRVVLVRGYSWWIWLLLILPASFFLVGLVGLVRSLLQSGTSAERRAAMAQRAAHLDLFDDGEQRGLHYPTIPTLARIIDSAGTRLAYRLPLDASPGWSLVGTLLICLLWNGILAWFVVLNVRGHLVGEGEWHMTALLAPFLAAGGGLVWFSARQVLLTAGGGATRLEISAHPLYPGETYELFVAQDSRLRRKRLQVSLVCFERATYRQGTDTRTEVVPVFEQCLFERETFADDQSAGFEETCEVRVPEGAMHSFLASHNEVRWEVVVEGTLEKWPNYRRAFPVVVYPPREGSESP